MSKNNKLKCGECGKPFRATRASQLFCADCEAKRRQRKAQAGPVKVASATQPSAGKPTWMSNTPVRDANAPYTTAQPAAPRPPTRPAAPPTATRPTAPTRPPRPKRERQPPTPRFEPTPEQLAAIEARYLELAQPEFDGIRTQIATELGVPKRVVKETVNQLRARTRLPSWWDMQGFQGEPADLERIRAAYERHLPVPPIGVHKVIAAELSLPPTQVYRGISTIRQALGLPHFNDPTLHPEMPPAATPQPALP